MKKNYFESVKSVSELNNRLQKLVLIHMMDEEVMNAIRAEYSQLRENLVNHIQDAEIIEVIAEPTQEPTQDPIQEPEPAKQPETAEGILRIVEYSENAILVTGFAVDMTDKAIAYKTINRAWTAIFNKHMPNKCKLNVNLRDGMYGYIISKKHLTEAEKLVTKLNKRATKKAA